MPTRKIISIEQYFDLFALMDGSKIEYYGGCMRIGNICFDDFVKRYNEMTGEIQEYEGPDEMTEAALHYRDHPPPEDSDGEHQRVKRVVEAELRQAGLWDDD